MVPCAGSGGAGGGLSERGWVRRDRNDKDKCLGNEGTGSIGHGQLVASVPVPDQLLTADTTVFIPLSFCDEILTGWCLHFPSTLRICTSLCFKIFFF